MALIARAAAKGRLDKRFAWWNKSGTWGRAYNCGYDDDGNNVDWVTEADIKAMCTAWEAKTAHNYVYRTTLSSSSATMDFLCHTKKPSDGTSFNFHLKFKKA